MTQTFNGRDKTGPEFIKILLVKIIPKNIVFSQINKIHK